MNPKIVRTDEEIADQIKRLMAVRDLVPPESFFGDNNLAAIDIQLRVLRERLSEEDVLELEAEDYAINEGQDTALWLSGEDDPDYKNGPAKGWEEMVS